MSTTLPSELILVIENLIMVSLQQLCDRVAEV